MSRFEQLNNNISSVLNTLIESQNLCKAIYYPSFDPLNEPDIEDTGSLLFTNIYPYPRIPDISDAATTYLDVVFDSFNLGSTDAVKEGYLKFVIITHNSLWSTLNGLRPFVIMSEIDKIFNDKRIVGIKKLQFEKTSLFIANEKFSGYQLLYKVVIGN